ncbi:MAG TPA: alpha/beta hydrolase domain-containing protein [Candidatus Polarisedimenticolaceae bacterium]|nr:alpha/beta hydrolase domain-containing protein [Candidatus Polarisedimenticolaceae bacterium]
MRRTTVCVVLGGLIGAWAGDCAARVTRVEIGRTEEVLDGKPFGSVGPYEKLVGTVHFAVDPGDPANAAVVDLDLAPTNAGGEVTFRADLYLLRPKRAERGNGTLLVEVANRGGKGVLTLLNGAVGSLDPTGVEHFGDGFLLRRGFSVAWVGWQFDVRDETELVRLDPPAATGRSGLVRSDFVVAERATFQPWGHVIAGRIGGTEYPVADPDDEQNVLTVRDHPTAERRTIDRRQWSFARDGGTINGIDHPAGFEPGRIYELIYRAADPAIAGLGLAAIRDFASYAKHDETSLVRADRAIAFGISQSGRFLRQFLHQGFNIDERGRSAFDGVIAHTAGAGRGSFNHRFAQPSRDAQSLEALFYPTDLYPFADVPLVDPLSGREEGLLDRLAPPPDPPKIFYTNTSYEYWGRAASLIHTSPDGAVDARIPDNVRIFLLAGLQHFSRPLPPARVSLPQIRGRYVSNPNPSSWTMRALVVAMQRWVALGEPPPESAYPRIDEGTLVPVETVKDEFPEIPGVELPREAQLAYRIDYGPDWRSSGVVSEQPPEVGRPFAVLVPAVDADGNDRGGVRIPQLETPLATYTGWNLRDPSIGAPSERVSFLGSYFPFPVDEQSRQAAGDPRPSIGERYASFDVYRSRYTEAAMQSIARGLLLAEDLDDLIELGKREWHFATRGIELPWSMSSDALARLERTRRDMRFAYGNPPFRFGELRLPGGDGPFPVAVILHGGCWLADYDLRHVGALADAITAEGIASWTIEYNRVGDPHGGWPGTFLDVAAGADYLRELARDHPLALDRVIAVGHSAGGQLALWLAARPSIPHGSELHAPDPLVLRGVLGLAAAADLDLLHEREVCGGVIDELIGGGPDAFAERYDAASPARSVPRTPQILLNGALDPFWSSVANQYVEAARRAGADVRVIDAPESGHFEMIDPASTTWPLVRDALRELIGWSVAAD